MNISFLYYNNYYFIIIYFKLNFIVDPPFNEKIGNYLSERNMKMEIKSLPKVEFESKKYYNNLKKEI